MQTPPTVEMIKVREMDLLRMIQADPLSPVLSGVLELLYLREQRELQGLASCSLQELPVLQGKVQALKSLRKNISERVKEKTDGNS